MSGQAVTSECCSSSPGRSSFTPGIGGQTVVSRAGRRLADDRVPWWFRKGGKFIDQLNNFVCVCVCHAAVGNTVPKAQSQITVFFDR